MKTPFVSRLSRLKSAGSPLTPVLVALALTTLAASADPPDRYKRPSRGGHPDHHSRHVYGPGTTLRVLPGGCNSVVIGGVSYLEHGGVYFRPAPGGYVIVNRPAPAPVIYAPPRVGSIVATLPLGSVSVTIGGSIFHRWGSVYYRPAATGYVVVEQPKAVVVVNTPTVIYQQTGTPQPPTLPQQSTPAAYTSVWVGDREYLYRDGTFHRKTPTGTQAVSAPVGATFTTPPVGSRSIWIDDVEYFYLNSVFYRKTPQGCAVVAPPPNVYVSALPKEKRSIWAGNRQYFYVNGNFYEAKDQGFLITASPIVLMDSPVKPGVTLAAPPDGSLSVWVDDIEYFYFAGTFYRKHPTGYIATANPL